MQIQMLKIFNLFERLLPNLYFTTIDTDVIWVFAVHKLGSL